MANCCIDFTCTPETCMELPNGLTCRDCFYCNRCVTMFGAKPENTKCEFYPRRFREDTDR